MSSSVLQPALQDVLAASLADGGFADTKFYLYSKRVKGKPNAVHTLRTVYANSTILKAASPYFNGLLCGARSDSAIPRSDSYDDSEDSDLEDDDEDEPRRGVKTEYNSTASPVSETTQVSSSRAMRTVVINDAAATTWQSLVFYIYTGLISFAPLKSQGVQYREAEKVQHHSEFPHRPPMCSPKSMYNLADKLGLKELKERAASFIRLQLKPQNILDELFSSFTSKHPDILRTQVDFFRDNCRNMSFAAAMRRQLGRVASGELPHAVPAMVALYEEWVYGRPVSQPQWTRSVPPPQPMPISTSYSRTSSPSPIIIKCSPSRSPSPLYDLSRPIYSPMPSSKPGSTSQLSPSPQAITPQTPSHLSSALSSVTRTERGPSPRPLRCRSQEAKRCRVRRRRLRPSAQLTHPLRRRRRRRRLPRLSSWRMLRRKLQQRRRR
ncbi:hypothetical protein B0H21DRAFT_252565 [Amylocystis lapponica]|nr:hypothetical protein B0H21DRAFT_252565 [Amylocystis lapponica]